MFFVFLGFKAFGFFGCWVFGSGVLGCWALELGFIVLGSRVWCLGFSLEFGVWGFMAP